MSLPEHGAKVAVSAIDAMKSSPGLLALIFLQVATLAILLYVATTNAEHRQAREMLLLNRCLENGKGDRLS